MTKTELYFGMNIDGVAGVTDADFQRFVDGYITPQFPDGLTILKGQGQYRMANGTLVYEECRVVILIHEGMDNALDIICKLYCALYDQEAVLKVDHTVNVSFRG